MRLKPSNLAIFALSSLFLLTSSLPLAPRKVPFVEPLLRRATYSVVAVDGGPAATTTSANGYPPAVSTIIETIIQTPAPATTTKTKTIVETDTLPAVTEYIISTLTATPNPPLTITTDYSIIDVSSSPSTVKVPAPVPTSLNWSVSSSASTSLALAETSDNTRASSTPNTVFASPGTGATITTGYMISSTSGPSLDITYSSTPTSRSAAVTTSSIPYAPAYNPSTETATLNAAPITPSPTDLPSDDGQWHTTYPTWSNSTRTATPAVTTAQTTSLTMDTMPKLPSSSPVDVPADSVPGINMAEVTDRRLGRRDLASLAVRFDTDGVATGLRSSIEIRRS